jgi:predicted enzyme related to lactoylglutathione lyase
MRKLFYLVAAAAIYAAAPPTYATDAKPAGSPTVTTGAPIVFFDVAGPDAAKLHSFYSSVFGWAIDANNGIKTPKLNGTIRQDPPEKIIYIGVPDINAALAQITAAGGTVDTPRMVVPNVVTFALFKDPAGNRMGLVEMPKTAL